MIPAPKKSDHEDVAWALSTAEAQWTQGERAEAIKWLRRAAEAASEVEDDTRALELAKAIAELTASSPPPPPSRPPASVQLPRPPPIPNVAGVTPPLPPQSLPKPPLAPSAPLAPRPLSVAPRPVSGTPPRAPTARPPAQPLRPASKAPTPAKRQSRKSIPPKDEDRTDTEIAQPPPSAKDPRSQMPTTPPTSEADAWPTESMGGNEFAGLEAERTRVGEPFYSSASTPSGAPLTRIPTSQAVRVIVWRDANGVHLAPAGTTVTAITVDAMLVALDTTADLSAWLSKK